MKKLIGSLLLFVGLASAVPSFVRLVPITGLSSTTQALMTDSSLMYIGRGTSYATYGKLRVDTLRAYLFNNPQHYAMLDTVSGYTAVVTDSLYCTSGGGMVSCRMTAATGTSNATTHVLSRLPAAIRPAVANLTNVSQLTDSGAIVYQVMATVNTDGTISLANNGTAWTASGTFAITAGTTFRYQLY